MKLERRIFIRPRLFAVVVAAVFACGLQNVHCGLVVIKGNDNVVAKIDTKCTLPGKCPGLHGIQVQSNVDGVENRIAFDSNFADNLKLKLRKKFSGWKGNAFGGPLNFKWLRSGGGQTQSQSSGSFLEHDEHISVPSAVKIVNTNTGKGGLGLSLQTQSSGTQGLSASFSVNGEKVSWQSQSNGGAGLAGSGQIQSSSSSSKPVHTGINLGAGQSQSSGSGSGSKVSSSFLEHNEHISLPKIITIVNTNTGKGRLSVQTQSLGNLGLSQQSSHSGSNLQLSGNFSVNNGKVSWQSQSTSGGGLSGSGQSQSSSSSSKSIKTSGNFIQTGITSGSEQSQSSGSGSGSKVSGSFLEHNEHISLPKVFKIVNPNTGKVGLSAQIQSLSNVGLSQQSSISGGNLQLSGSFSTSATSGSGLSGSGQSQSSSSSSKSVKTSDNFIQTGITSGAEQSQSSVGGSKVLLTQTLENTGSQQSGALSENDSIRKVTFNPLEPSGSILLKTTREPTSFLEVQQADPTIGVSTQLQGARVRVDPISGNIGLNGKIGCGLAAAANLATNLNIDTKLNGAVKVVSHPIAGNIQFNGGLGLGASHNVGASLNLNSNANDQLQTSLHTPSIIVHPGGVSSSIGTNIQLGHQTGLGASGSLNTNVNLNSNLKAGLTTNVQTSSSASATATAASGLATAGLTSGIGAVLNNGLNLNSILVTKLDPISVPVNIGIINQVGSSNTASIAQAVASFGSTANASAGLKAVGASSVGLASGVAVATASASTKSGKSKTSVVPAIATAAASVDADNDDGVGLLGL